MKRPSPSWVIAGLPNIEIRIFRLEGVPIGSVVVLPDYIKKSRSIVSLTLSKNNGYAYEDNLCLFRCLVLHLGGSLWALETEAARLRLKAERDTGKSFEARVDLNTLADIEICFNIAINVYSLQEDKSAEVIRISNLDHKNVMHLNLYENHFSYIIKFKSFAKKYKCTNCGCLLKEAWDFI